MVFSAPHQPLLMIPFDYVQACFAHQSGRGENPRMVTILLPDHPTQHPGVQAPAR